MLGPTLRPQGANLEGTPEVKDTLEMTFEGASSISQKGHQEEAATLSGAPGDPCSRPPGHVNWNNKIDLD